MHRRLLLLLHVPAQAAKGACLAPAASPRAAPHPPPAAPPPAAAAEHKPSEEDSEGYMLHSILTFQHLRREAIRAELARLHEEMVGGAAEGAVEEEAAAEEAALEAEAEEEQVKSS
jgi:hypothetical protein